ARPAACDGLAPARRAPSPLYASRDIDAHLRGSPREGREGVRPTERRPHLTAARIHSRARCGRHHPRQHRTVTPRVGIAPVVRRATRRSEEHTSELQSRENLVCRLLLEKKTKETCT